MAGWYANVKIQSNHKAGIRVLASFHLKAGVESTSEMRNHTAGRPTVHPIRAPTDRPAPSNRVLLEKLTVPQLVEKFPTFYGTRRTITAFTGSGHLSLSWTTTTRSPKATFPPHLSSNNFPKMYAIVLYSNATFLGQTSKNTSCG